MAEEFRYDRAQIEPGWEETPEGFLRVRATFSRAGAQRYRRPDGSVAVEYRPEEEVARRDALLSLANLPVTLEHPPELLTPDTVREHQRGFTGSNVEYKSPFAYGIVTITDREAIDAVKRGDAREVSVGYRVQFDPTPGVTPQGERYDGIQKNISGNHLAITREARGGHEMRLHFDSAVADELITSTPQQEDNMSTAVAALSSATEALAGALAAQVRVDAKSRKAPPEDEEMEPTDEMEGEEEYDDEEEEMDSCGGRKDSIYDGDEEMVPRSLLEQALDERDEAIAAHERDLGRLDALVERIDALESDVDERLDSSGVDIDALVQQRLDLLDRCEAIMGERPRFDGLSEREVMIEALAAAGIEPDRFNDRSDDYVEAMFDTFAERGDGRSDSTDELITALGGIPTGDTSSAQDAARQRMIAAQREQFNKPLSITAQGAA